MKYWIIAVLILVSGCEYGEEESEISLDCLIEDWQARESIIVPECKNGDMDIKAFNAMRENVYQGFKYITDADKWGYSYWQTYDETLSDMSGDCEDICTLIYISALLAGFPADQVGGVIFQRTYEGFTDIHAAACIFSPNHGEILYIADELALVHISFRPHYKPLWGFTLDTMWMY